MRRLNWQKIAGAKGHSSTAATAFAALAMQQVATFVLILLAASYLPPAEYGLYTISLVFATFIQTLTYSGVFHFIVTEKGDDSAILDTTFWLIIGISVTGSAILALAAPYIGRAFDAAELPSVIRFLALTQPVSAGVAWISAVLMRQKRMHAHYTIMMIQNVSSLFIGVALLILWQSVYALVAFRFAKSIVGGVIYFGYTRILPRFSFDRNVARKATSYAGGIYGSRFLNFFANYGADLILGLVYTTAEAGLYRFGSRLATAAMDIAMHPLRNFALAQFGAANRNNEGFTPLAAKFVSTAMFLMGGVAIAIYVFGEQMVELMFREEYLGALVVTYALATRAVLGIGDQFAEPILAAKGKTGVIMAHHGFWAFVQIVLLATTAAMGMNILAWAQAAVAGATSVMAFYLVHRFAAISLGPVIRSAVRTALLLLGIGLVILLIQGIVSSQVGNFYISLAISFGISLAIGLAGLILALRLRIVNLSVFAN